MVYNRTYDAEDAMPQTVPSAGYTPPCDYSTFADNFDLSLLPGGDLPLSPSTLLYTQSPPHVSCGDKPKIFTTFYPNSPDTNLDNSDIELGPDFQKLLVPEKKDTNISLFPHSPVGGIFLEVPTAKNFHPNSPQGALSPYSSFSSSPSDCIGVYPTSPSDSSTYLNSPNPLYPRSPADTFGAQYIKEEPFSPYQQQNKDDLYNTPYKVISAPPSPHITTHNNNNNTTTTTTTATTAQQQQQDNYNLLDIFGEALLDKKIKQESTVDFREILENFQSNDSLRELLEDNYKPQIVPEVKPQTQDHQLLREVLKDTSFQDKYNIKPFDLELATNFMNQDIKMEDPDEPSQTDTGLMASCARDKIEPMLSLAIEQVRKDISSMCTTLNIPPDPRQWTPAQVLAWIELTTRQFGLQAPIPENWDILGSNLVTLSEEDFTRRASQSGSILYAQLEIWKAACLDEEMNMMHWAPESASSNASSGDMSDEEEEELPTTSTATLPPSKPSTSRGGSHIHLWQFLKELLASPHLHGSCIRWLDRTKGVFKIEDSVRVAKLWGKRKNRPAMNYDKLSRSIRQYYKKGIMKKTERSQRLVYQFCHPYCL